MMKVEMLHSNGLVIKVVPATRGCGKRLENVVLNQKNSGERLKCANSEGGHTSQGSAKDEGGESFGFLKGNPLLERIKYFSQSRRSWPERIFWFIAFILSLSAASRLIYRVWSEDRKVPVTVTFLSESQNIDSIPFPAVTLCNMNQFPKSKLSELEGIANSPSHENYTEAHHELTFVRSVCNGHLSFAKHFNFAYERARSKVVFSESDTIAGERQDEMMDFLIKNTQPCDKLIRLCKLGEETFNCSDLFKPVITDHGKCCTFNMLPLPLLLRNPDEKEDGNATFYGNPVLGNNPEASWPHDEINKWKDWNYDKGFILKGPTRAKYPWRQKRAGLPFGLSVLVDPNVDEYYCPTSDSRGMRYILHSPLERPQVMALASVAGVDKEVLIEVHPEMTVADDDIKDIQSGSRNCLFGSERRLQLFGPYTSGNCIEECVARVLAQQCNCTFFFMPRFDGVRICNNDPVSAEFQCIQHARIVLQGAMDDKCGNCAPLCESIAYNYETTVADLQDKKELWLDPDPTSHNPEIPDWAQHQMSILHFFFGSESTVPKLRKRRYATTDLIANTGGLLGLCLGFSVLSAVEIVYFVLLRSCSKGCGGRCRRLRRTFKRLWQCLKAARSKSCTSNTSRIISPNPAMIPVYPSFHFTTKTQR